MTLTRLALTMRITQAATYHEPRDSISHDWLTRLDQWNMVPLPVPNALSAPEAYLDGLDPDLLVLTGGDDLGVTPRRDATETALLKHAVERNLPVLGICRGLQLINHVFGGSLRPIDGHLAEDHEVTLGAAWREFYGPSARVNSFHRLGVAKEGLGDGLAVAAVDGNGMVEALHHRELPVAAVMWHPERKDALDGDSRLVRRLATDGAFWR